ncbi:hypothetical protein T11_9172, partial [Trichinella zimbabwensis]
IVLHEINSSDGISKFIFDPEVHRLPFDPKPLSTPRGRCRPLWLLLISIRVCHCIPTRRCVLDADYR